VVSPLVPANLVDHCVHDHASVLATVEAIFNLKPMTQRDAQANNLLSLASLKTPRLDAPTSLPAPANPMTGERAMRAAAMGLPGPPATKPTEAVDADRNMPGFLYSAMRSDLDLSPPEQRAAILARVGAIHTRNDARLYIEEVRQKIHSARRGMR
jgi:phospholipase C